MGWIASVSFFGISEIEFKRLFIFTKLVAKCRVNPLSLLCKVVSSVGRNIYSSNTWVSWYTEHRRRNGKRRTQVNGKLDNPLSLPRWQHWRIMHGWAPIVNELHLFPTDEDDLLFAVQNEDSTFPSFPRLMYVHGQPLVTAYEFVSKFVWSTNAEICRLYLKHCYRCM